QWFLRGVFDADGDTRAVEAGFKSQARVKIRMKSQQFIVELKNLLESSFNVSVNGPYNDQSIESSYIQVERQADIIKLSNMQLFFHPIKRWRLDKVKEQLLNKNTLKAFVAESNCGEAV
ncbi:MAG: LAGLIDADG family homing endonuclease, partial [archaeon]|nr:LAGLIDADG family homing endonuclease [archaeon]